MNQAEKVATEFAKNLEQIFTTKVTNHAPPCSRTYEEI
jgi:hypothetical protein